MAFMQPIFMVSTHLTPISLISPPQLYVNAKKVGQAVMPLKRPTITQITPPADLWIHAGELSPNPNDPTWTGVGKKAPVIMVGCHRNSDEYKFSGFLKANASYDELTIWTRKLRTNKSVDETLYFVGGYSEWGNTKPMGSMLGCVIDSS